MRQAALRQRVAWVERSDALKRLALLGARLGDGGERQPNLGLAWLIGGQDAQ